jgi:peptidoglycan-associated lipoprotein
MVTMSKLMKILITVTMVFALSACSDQPVKDDTSATVDDQSGDAGGTGVSTAGVDRLGEINGIAIDQDGSPDYVRTVYFEYDSSEVRSEFIPLINAHGRLLASDSSRRVVLEGHADERGSREYNIALGERRAISVRRLLLGSGASSSQIRVLSYGEERPVMLGHDESSWSKNRRVEIRYE